MRRSARSLGLTVFMVTHDLDSIYKIADRVAVLVDERLRIGTIDELRRDNNPWIARYFGGVRGRAAEARNDAPSPVESGG